MFQISGLAYYMGKIEGHEAGSLVAVTALPRSQHCGCNLFSFSKVDRGGPILDGENSPRVDNIRPFRYNLMFSFLASISLLCAPNSSF